MIGETHEPQKGLGRAVRTLRERAGLDRSALADRAELSAAFLDRLESGAEDPTWGDVRRVATALGISLETLSELAEELEVD